MVRVRALIAICGALLCANQATAQGAFYKSVTREQLTTDDLIGVHLDKIIVRGAGAAIDSILPPLKPDYVENLDLKLDPSAKNDGTGAFIYQTREILPATADTDAKLTRLLKLLNIVEKITRERASISVEYAVLNTTLEPQSLPNDTYYPRMWNLQPKGAISVPGAWKLTTGSSRVSVAVLDTGIRPDHPDIEPGDNLGPGYDFVSNEKSAGDNGPEDSDPRDEGDSRIEDPCGLAQSMRPEATWHGNHVAGIIGAGQSNNNKGITGLNHKVSVIPVRIGGKCGADIEDTLRAMRWVVALPTRTSQGQWIARPYLTRIINIGFNARLKTFEAGCDHHTQRVIDDVSKWAIIVVPAGNDGTDTRYTRFGSCNRVLIAGASGPSNPFWSMSNHADGQRRELILAPGEGIWSYVNASAADPDGVAVKSGTSMAAAHVSGVLALMRARNPDLSNAELLSILDRTARRVDDCPGCGMGLIDAAAAVAAVPPPIVEPRPDPTPDRTPPPHRHSGKKHCKCCRAPCRGHDDDPGDDDDDDHEPDVVIIKKYYPVPCRPCGYHNDHGYHEDDD
jgi:serine protease